MAESWHIRIALCISADKNGRDEGYGEYGGTRGTESTVSDGQRAAALWNPSIGCDKYESTVPTAAKGQSPFGIPFGGTGDGGTMSPTAQG